MGNLTLFHYREGNSLFHWHNPFLKLCEMILAVSVIALSGSWSLALCFVFLIWGILSSGTTMRNLLKNFRMFWWLLVFIFIAGFLTEKSGLIPRQILSGSVECLRFADYILTGFLFTQTTSPDKLYGVIYSLFRPVPFLPHRKIASFFLIIFTLLPKAVDTYGEVSESISARAMGNSKRLIHRAVYRIYPLMINMFLKTDALSDALISRCFNGDAELQNRDLIKLKDIWIFLLIIGMIALFYSPTFYLSLI